MDLIDKSLIDYINDVDAHTSTPGGGSVAALVGALGIALAKMMAHFSFDKKKFKEADKLAQNKFILAFKELDLYKDILVKGVDDDAISYKAVMQAYASHDEKAIQQALNYSAYVALEMQNASLNALKYADKLVDLGNKNLYSDMIASAILLLSCNEMARLNVLANANLIKDGNVKDDYLNKSSVSFLKAKKLKNKIYNKINK